MKFRKGEQDFNLSGLIGMLIQKEKKAKGAGLVAVRRAYGQLMINRPTP